MTVLKIAGSKPACATRIAPIFSVAEISLALGLRGKEDCFILIKFELSIIDPEDAACFQNHADSRIVRGALRLCESCSFLGTFLLLYVIAYIESLLKLCWTADQLGQILHSCLLLLVGSDYT